MKHYGLIGKKLNHSFSPAYFFKKFELHSTDADYQVFELASISDFENLIQSKVLHGLNVTIPYKEAIIPFLDKLSLEAKTIGAVNTIQFLDGKLIGYNTDWLGFWQDISPLLKKLKKRALILGTGGSSKAVKFALEQHGWKVHFVSRSNTGDFSYSDLDSNLIAEYSLIVNTTPLGMYPDISAQPNFPVHHLLKHQVVYDLIYNPSETRFLKESRAHGVTAKNGYGMLLNQAELSYTIWQEST